MKKAVFTVLSALLLSGYAGQTASAQNPHAKCAEEIKEVTKAAENFSGDAPALAAIQSMIARAKEAQAEGKARKCLNLMKSARNKL